MVEGLGGQILDRLKGLSFGHHSGPSNIRMKKRTTEEGEEEEKEEEEEEEEEEEKEEE